MRKRRGARGLILLVVNVVVIIAAALIIQSRAAVDQAPSYASFDFPAESDSSLLSRFGTGTIPASASSSSSAPASSSSPGQDLSAHVVPPAAAAADDSSAVGNEAFEELWYGQAHSAYTPLGAFANDSGSWTKSGAPLGGYGSSSNASASGAHRAASGAGYAGGGGGGFSSPGGGGGMSAPQSSASSTGAGLRSSSGDSGASASAADIPASLPTQAQGNPLFGGSNAFSAPLFPLAQFPGIRSSGAIATGATLPGPGAGSSAAVTQLQQPVSVPEPSTLFLLGSALAFVAYRSRKPTRHS